MKVKRIGKKEDGEKTEKVKKVMEMEGKSEWLTLASRKNDKERKEKKKNEKGMIWKVKREKGESREGKTKRRKTHG